MATKNLSRSEKGFHNAFIFDTFTLYTRSLLPVFAGEEGLVVMYRQMFSFFLKINGAKVLPFF
jgi:hypothetical protein